MRSRNDQMLVNVVGFFFLLISCFGHDSLLRANGEIQVAFNKLWTIPSEALGSVKSTKEPLETRTTSNASSNWSHERPATDISVEDVVQSSRKLESRDKELGEGIAVH